MTTFTEANQAGRGVAEGGGRYESGQQPGGAPGDRRIGVVWHTQGSGKSLTMAFYAGDAAAQSRCGVAGEVAQG